VERSISLDTGILTDFPEAQVRFVIGYGLRNREDWPAAIAALDTLEQDIAGGAWTPFTKEQPPIASWHDAYRKFGTNPSRMRPSVDALSRRLTRDAKLPRINSAVDAYNLVSVKYGSPAGAFDLDAVPGDVVIRYARPGDEFVPMGKPDEVESPSDGEVVYAQGSRVLTRHWNYRDADHAKVTEDSKNAVFIIERISASAVPDDVLAEAQAMMADLFTPHADRVATATIDASRPTAVIPG
jgi:DNA/RNA-binding domain of Phe-tRNA-synthetase-like protein